MAIELQLLIELLTWLLAGGGLGVMGWWLASVIEAHWPWFANLRYDHKRCAAFAIVAAFAAPAGYGALQLAAWLGILTLPATPQAWLSTLFEITAAAVMSSQGAHGAAQARKLADA